MRKFKNIIGLILSMVMAFTMSFSVVSADTTDYSADQKFTITINNAYDGHTYSAYQVFKGTLNSEGVLSDIDWGTGVDSDGLLSALKSSTDSSLSGKFSDCTTAAQVAKVLSDNNADGTENSAIAKAFAQVVQDNVNAAATGSATASATDSNTTATVTIDNLSAGYYLVQDTTEESTTDKGAYTQYILQVVKDVTVTPKASVPSVDKEVMDTNDSKTGTTETWQKTADYDIGDMVPFQLTATLPNDEQGSFGDYTAYAITFNDTLSAGLTCTRDTAELKVYKQTGSSERTEIASGFDVTYPTDESNTLSIKFSNVKSTEVNAAAGDKIIVEYKAKLNDKALIGSAGNDNKVDLTYSNNPNDTSTGKTKESQVKVFTYQTVFTKLDGSDNSALAGAEFTLYKYNANSTESDKFESKGEVEATGDGSNIFTFSGLDDGYYKLVESKTPTGYNTMDPVYFEIAATHSVNGSTGDLELTDLTGTQVTYDSTTNGFSSITGATVLAMSKKDSKVDAGELDANVLNYKGSTLPSTGGRGTKVLYTLGGILVVAAGVLLVTKRRMGNN